MMDIPPPVVFAPAVPNAPIVSGGSFVAPPRSTAVIVAYAADKASCGGVDISFVGRETPLPSGATRYELAEPASVQLQPPREAADVELSFSIDAQGRAVGIRRETAPAARPVLYADSSDLEPALAVSRFAAAQPRIGCRVTYRASTTAVAAASPELLSRFGASGAGAQARVAVARLRPAGSTCGSATALRPLVLAYPDASKVAIRRGALAYSTAAFDIDPSGKPIAVRMLASNDAAHGTEVMRAIGASRFAQGPAKGCVMGSAQRGQTTTPPPPRPSTDTIRRAEDTCAQVKPAMKFAVKPAFPLAFRKRGVEGWAIVRYDVAPWGDPGNIEVVAAEPAATFGEVAKQVVRSGKAEASGTGATGCLAPVRFRIAEDDEGGGEDGDETIR